MPPFLPGYDQPLEQGFPLPDSWLDAYFLFFGSLLGDFQGGRVGWLATLAKGSLPFRIVVNADTGLFTLQWSKSRVLRRLGEASLAGDLSSSH